MHLRGSSPPHRHQQPQSRPPPCQEKPGWDPRIPVGVENGYDEVNVQIPEEEKRRNLLRQILSRNKFFFTKSFAEETRVIGQRARNGLLRSDRTRAPLGRYVATERPFCSRSDRARVETRSLRSDRARAGARSLRSDPARAGARSPRSDRARTKSSVAT
ncbi:hypothetical protein DY000_02022428 [Brassica cretica]|uniref:Uncharacterized protein n=1 Tax=Brassica cretica TaxID=69181 RepID=A0ABQ7DZR8_BRACR|nr:hypothetical protein DY000_02022428 [Brassica cretica]